MKFWPFCLSILDAASISRSNTFSTIFNRWLTETNDSSLHTADKSSPIVVVVVLASCIFLARVQIKTLV